MDEQFYFSVRKQFKQINEGKVKLRLFGVSDKELALEPRFFPKENNQIACYQHKYLGFYVLRAAFRGLLLSVNYVVAGDICLKNKLLGPSIVNYYTAAYHLLGSYLALNARIVFDSQLIWKGKKLVDENKFVIASYSKGNWHLSFKAWGHSGKWRELKELRATEYPDSFKNLFKYWYGQRIKEEISQEEYFKSLVEPGSIGTPLNLNDIIDEFLKRIGETRHLALYASFGSEPEVVSNLINGDAISDNGIDYQAKQYKKFAYSFLDENIRLLVPLLNFIDANRQTRKWLDLAIFQPWYDMPLIKKLANKSSVTQLTKLKKWLTDSRQKKIEL